MSEVATVEPRRIHRASLIAFAAEGPRGFAEWLVETRRVIVIEEKGVKENDQ